LRFHDPIDITGHISLLSLILGKTDGVPLFVEELTKSILESADLSDAGDRWEYVGRAGTLAIPLDRHRCPALTTRARPGAGAARRLGLGVQQGTPPDAVYIFKHALVQDAAYDSLLKARRQQLHGKIAKAIEERWPHIEANEPELLAHHYTEAKRPRRRYHCGEERAARR
jgi:predicted ATPase